MTTSGRGALAVGSDGVIHYSSFPVGHDARRVLVRGRPVHGPLPDSPDRDRAVRSGLPSDVRRGNKFMTTDYEITYIVRPNLEEAEVDTKVDAISAQLAANGGEIGEIEKMGKRRLAYEINDVREGYYVVMKFKSDAAQAKELERQMRLNEDVMRQLLIKLDD